MFNTIKHTPLSRILFGCTAGADVTELPQNMAHRRTMMKYGHNNGVFTIQFAGSEVPRLLFAARLTTDQPQEHRDAYAALMGEFKQTRGREFLNLNIKELRVLSKTLIAASKVEVIPGDRFWFLHNGYTLNDLGDDPEGYPGKPKAKKPRKVVKYRKPARTYHLDNVSFGGLEDLQAGLDKLTRDVG